MVSAGLLGGHDGGSARNLFPKLCMVGIGNDSASHDRLAWRSRDDATSTKCQSPPRLRASLVGRVLMQG